MAKKRERDPAKAASEQEQELTRKILESVAVPILIARPSDSRILYANSAFAQVGRIALHQLIGTNTAEYFVDLAEWKKIAAALRRQGFINGFEARFRRGDGNVCWAYISSRMINYENETCVLTSIIDITERKQIEEAIKDEQQRTRMILENVTVPTLISRLANSEILYANPAVAQVSRVSLDKLIGRRTVDYFVHTADRDKFVEILQRQGYASDFEVQLRRDDGEFYWALLSARPIQYRNEACVLSSFIDISERQRAEKALQESEEKYSAVVQHAKDGVILIQEKVLLFVNKAMAEMLGYSVEEMESTPFIDYVAPESRATVAARVEARLAGKDVPQIYEAKLLRKDGTAIDAELSARVIRYHGKSTDVGIIRDITERKRVEEEKLKLESQLLQSQKMESIGRLAGGVAHDFNNMLSVILGNAELMRPYLSGDTPALKYLRGIEAAGLHSRETTRQLLAFSRKQIVAPRSIQLNDLIASTQQTIARLIGEDIDLRFRSDKDLWKISIDPSQINQILINLVVNSRDAMPDGGKLTIETSNVTLDADFCRKHLEFTPGQYVLMEISDSGVGMSEETIAHTFEPFFTTKAQGEGTGLGLATVYGIVKQNNGQIQVYSELGSGTTFKMYFPRFMGENETTEKIEEILPTSVTGAVLVVEDDDMVRHSTTAMLERIGYKVLVAKTPSTALSLAAKTDTPIDLLLTDVVMPEMSGPELRDKIKAIRPNIQVLFMSGYTSNVIVHRGILEEGVHFIQKPFSMKDLAVKVHQTIRGE